MHTNSGYQKFADAIYGLIKFAYKIILSNLYFAILNLPLVLGLIFLPLDNGILGSLIAAMLSINVLPSIVIIVRYFRDDMSLVKTAKIVYQTASKELFILSASILIVLFILYVDIYFFKNIGFKIGEIIFSGLLVACAVFLLNLIQVGATYASSIKNLLLVTVAYTKELTLSAITTIMFAFVMIMLSIYVVPILSIVVLGGSIAVHTWFSTKARKLMESKITKEDILEY